MQKDDLPRPDTKLTECAAEWEFEFYDASVYWNVVGTQKLNPSPVHLNITAKSLSISVYGTTELLKIFPEFDVLK